MACYRRHTEMHTDTVHWEGEQNAFQRDRSSNGAVTFCFLGAIRKNAA